jgi:hypothetical protein
MHIKKNTTLGHENQFTTYTPTTYNPDGVLKLAYPSATSAPHVRTPIGFESQFISTGTNIYAVPGGAYAYSNTPAGTLPIDAVTEKIISTNALFNKQTQAGINNTNIAGNALARFAGKAVGAIGALGIPSVSQFGSGLAGALGGDAIYATAPYDNLNAFIPGTKFPLPHPDFRTKKISLGSSISSIKTKAKPGDELATEIAALTLMRRRDGLSAALRGSVIAATYAAQSSTIGAYSVFNLDSKYGWGNHSDPMADRNDFTSRSHVSTKWPKGKLKDVEKGKARRSTAWNKTIKGLEVLTPFRGDRVTVIDFGKRNWENIYRWVPNSALSKDTGFTNTVQGISKVLGANPYGLTKDFIKFFFTGPNLSLGSKDAEDDVIVFRAALTSFSDQFTPSWSAVTILGRPDPNYHYSGYSRDLDLSFTIYATDRDELKFIYRKLNALAGYTAPAYSADSISLKAPWLRITVGDLLVSQPVLINSLGYTFADADSVWEINIEDDPEMMEVPHKIDVQMSLYLITDAVPEFGGSMYTLAKRADQFGTLPGNDNWLSDTSTIATQDETRKNAKEAVAAVAKENNKALNAFNN